MIHICLATRHDTSSAWWRQTPKNDGVWQTHNTQFHLNDETQCSWLCVFDEPPDGWTTHIPKERRILMITEPKTLKTYALRYLDHFHHVLSPYPRHSSYRGRWSCTQPSLNWHYGITRQTTEPITIASWHDIVRVKTKTQSVSVICSQKKMTSFQLQRLRFLAALEHELGDSIAVFGRDDHFISDKATGLDTYKYHIVLENNEDKHFWTEKLADAYLAECYPIYAGCPNLHDYFPKQAYTSINIHDISQAIRIVKDVIASELWQQNRNHILTAKRLVMERYNLFPTIAHLAHNSSHRQEHQLLATAEHIDSGDNVVNFTDISQRKWVERTYHEWYNKAQSLKKRLTDHWRKLRPPKK